MCTLPDKNAHFPLDLTAKYTKQGESMHILRKNAHFPRNKKRKTTNYMNKIIKTAIGLAALALTSCSMNETGISSEGYIGKSDIKIENGAMTPEALLSFGRISDPQVSPDGTKILYGVSYTSIGDNRSVRNLFICNLDGSDNRQLTESGKSINNARWLADGKHIAFLMGGQIWTAGIKDGKLTGEKQISNVEKGIGEFKLSPDQTKVLYISYVKSAVKEPADCYADLGKATAYETDDLMYRHWDHTVIEIPHTYAADFSLDAVTGAKDILTEAEARIELPTEPWSGLEQLAWSPDSRFIAYSCRKLTGKRYAFSTNTEIYLYNIETSETAVIPMGGGYDTEPAWSPDGSKIAWLSMERDGYEADKQRLMVAELDWSNPAMPKTADIKDITADFKYNAAGPVWSDDSKSLYFNSLTEGLQAMYEASSDENGAWTINRLTADNLWYDFSSPFHIAEAADGSKTYYTTLCSMDFPTEFVAMHNNEYQQITNENGHILDQIAEHETEARHIRTVDGKDMLTWVLYPPHFDPSKTYPAITILLGGPQGTLSQGWSYRWNYRLMAAQGYVVVLPNRRGTTAFGQEWTEQISGDYPGLNMQDYLVAAKEVKSEPYVGKMAACGASYGGYSVYNMCGIHGDVFDAFIAHAGIFNQEHMYMTTEEMWFPNFDNGGLHEAKIDPRLGTADAPVGPAGDGVTFGGIRQGGSPWSNLPKAVNHYKNSPHKKVTSWHTPLMVIHGAMDYRVPVEQGMAAYNAAQLMGVPSRLLIFPDENHWILKPQNALLWHREYFRWLDQWCR